MCLVPHPGATDASPACHVEGAQQVSHVVVTPPTQLDATPPAQLDATPHAQLVIPTPHTQLDVTPLVQLVDGTLPAQLFYNPAPILYHIQSVPQMGKNRGPQVVYIR